MAIIPQFSEFLKSYILSNEKAVGVLGHLKEFILSFDKCNKIHSDNHKEFCNSLFNKYCIDSGITHIWEDYITCNHPDVLEALIKK